MPSNTLTAVLSSKQRRTQYCTVSRADIPLPLSLSAVHNEMSAPPDRAAISLELLREFQPTLVDCSRRRLETFMAGPWCCQVRDKDPAARNNPPFSSFRLTYSSHTYFDLDSHLRPMTIEEPGQHHDTAPTVVTSLHRSAAALRLRAVHIPTT
jgi:hypothetical protein